jgi:hypothetical protein
MFTEKVSISLISLGSIVMVSYTSEDHGRARVRPGKPAHRDEIGSTGKLRPSQNYRQGDEEVLCDLYLFPLNALSGLSASSSRHWQERL